MGTLANSLFRALLGWVRTLSAEIWNTFSSPEGTTLLSWLGAHWKGLALVMCAAGLAVDLVVYLFRWQPYRVWQSRRRRHREEERPSSPDREDIAEPEGVNIPPAGPQSDQERRQAWIPETDTGEAWVNSGVRLGAEPEGTEQAPEMSDTEVPDIPEPEEEDPWRAYRRPAERYIRNAYDAESEAEQLEAWRRPEEQALPAEEKETTITERFEQAIRPRRRRSMRAMLSDRPETQAPAPEQLIDRNEAYRRPVYPRSWHESE